MTPVNQSISQHQGPVGEDLARVADELGFSGVIRIDVDGESSWSKAFGLADRRNGIANQIDTRFSIASGTKGFTALTAMSLIESGLLTPITTARSVLGADLPLVDELVTIEYLLSHRSGIGDYLDESQSGDINDYVMPVPIHEFASTENYLPILEGHAQVFAPGSQFAYNNSGFVILALILERVTGQKFEDLVQERVCQPAELLNTGFIRSDELPGDVAIGYLAPDGRGNKSAEDSEERLRSNALHLPVMGSGDGGLFSTVDDLYALWVALTAGRIVSAESWQAMARARSDAPDEKMRYGLGFWLHETGSAVILEGMDAGVSMRTLHDPDRGVTYSVLSNTSSGTWPMARKIEETLGL